MKKIVILNFFMLSAMVGCKNVKLNDTNQNISNTVRVNWDQDAFLKPYKDSLLGIKDEKSIPNFLLEDCFDYKHKFFWKPKHNPVSFRKQIIQSIKDTNTIKFLIENNDRISSSICEEMLEHPYGGESTEIDGQGKTNMFLLLKRFNELKSN